LEFFCVVAKNNTEKGIFFSQINNPPNPHKKATFFGFFFFFGKKRSFCLKYFTPVFEGEKEKHPGHKPECFI